MTSRIEISIIKRNFKLEAIINELEFYGCQSCGYDSDIGKKRICKLKKKFNKNVNSMFEDIDECMKQPSLLSKKFVDYLWIHVLKERSSDRQECPLTILEAVYNVLEDEMFEL
jgi:hypothetical protein